MNKFEKALKQIERKIPHYSYQVEVIPSHPLLKRKFGIFEPFEQAKENEKHFLIDGKMVKVKSAYRHEDFYRLKSERRLKNWSMPFTIFYDDENETEKERRDFALQYGIKEFERELGDLLRLSEFRYGNGWTVKIVASVEHPHYRESKLLSMEEFVIGENE